MEKKAPRLRTDIDIIPASYQGEKVFFVKDLLGLVPQSLLLRSEALKTIGLIDGKRNIRDIQLELIRLRGGVFIRTEDVEDMISRLDEVFLIDNQHYRREKNKIIREYMQQQTREASFAGIAYPEQPDKLTPYIQSILDSAKDQRDVLNGKQIAAVIAPHIDLGVAKNVYAKAYQVLRGLSPQKVLLLGTGHSLQESCFSLTTKDFITPLGRVKTDREEVERLKETCPPGIIAPYDIAHKNEHSLEFQILFLQHLFGEDFMLMPVLCGSFHKVLHQVSKPREIPGMSAFLSGLQLFLENNENSVLIVAGVDFSHIGPKFGHRGTASSLLLEAKENDRSLLDAICRSDVTTFWAEAQRVNNRYNVCGFSALALLLELLSGQTGYLLGYDFWMEEATRSAVSFAALAFFR